MENLNQNNLDFYFKENLPVIPCYNNSRKPIGDKWQDKPTGDIKRFSPGDNIGWHLLEETDIDIDNPNCHKFLNGVKTRCCAVYGRKSNPQSHLLFAGKNEFKKWVMHDDFEPWFNKFRKKGTILEIRSGKGFQSIVPGSVLEDEEVRWDRYKKPETYPGNLRKDIELVVFATMLSIIYALKGKRDDFCYAIACLLKKWGKWSEDKINKFIEKLADKNDKKIDTDKDDNRTNFGTRAYKGNKPKGLPWLINEMNFTEAGIKDIFKVIGIEIGREQKEKFKMDPGAWRNGILGHDLDKEETKPIDWVVEGLIAPGLNLIAGKSKIGKSFAAFDLSYQVQIGGTWLGHKCIKGKVLHYSLEDLRRRTKNRWETMGIKPLETNYQFRDRQPKIPLLTLGLEEEIEDWIKNTPDAKLVIIDPYQKVKYTQGGYKLNAYENDNYNLQDLQTLSTKYEIAIVLIHHLKKVKADDVFDEITGSAGIQSNSDSMIVISSDRTKGKNPILHCIPKDAEQQEFEISLNSKCIWENLGKPGMAALTKIQNAIIKIMKDDEERTPMEIIVKVQEDNKKDNWGDEHIRKEITRLVEKSHLMKTKRGHYKQVPF